MARRRRLLISALLLPLFAGSIAAAPLSASNCSGQDQIDGFCTDGTLDGGEAVIRGDSRIDGGNNGGNNGGGGGGGNRAPDGFEQDRIDADNRGGVDGPGSPGAGVPPENVGVCVAGPACLINDITISDLASFRPIAPTLEMEPDGWMLVGLPANFIAKTSTHVVSGTLLDYPLDVRFTPSSYAWSWGDGSTSRSSVPGASWASLGLPEFSPTPTSHVYDTKGVYQISVTVSHSVEFSIDSLPWRSISGTLPGPATIVAAVAGSAKTVLVERECTENPSGPGC
jgi:hypothetical protein